MFALVTTASLKAQNASGDSPTGSAGNFGGDVTTAGRYDPYTGNIKRVVTDLVVPGYNGDYPFAFTRTFNSNYEPTGYDQVYFGDGPAWRHSYQWAVTPDFGGYDVAYPDGAVVFYQPVSATDPRHETFLRGPAGTSDRLEVQSGTANFILHTADGGRIVFANSYLATSIVDPHGATTTLQYFSKNSETTPKGALSIITEPSGRTLTFGYTHWKKSKMSWYVLSSATASSGQQVSYSYSYVGIQTNMSGKTAPYLVLTGATYNYESSTVGVGGSVNAQYNVATPPASVPELVGATDPHYAGAMTSIRYSHNPTPTGLLLAEQNNGGNVGENVSQLKIIDSQTENGPSVSTETRGDPDVRIGHSLAPITRALAYGTLPTADFPIGPFPASAHPFFLSATKDYEGSFTYYNYDQQGFLSGLQDRAGNVTTYLNEPITGKVTQIKYPDGRVNRSTWTDKNDLVTSPQLNPYYLQQQTDERGNTIYFYHDPVSGFVSSIVYPDGSESFTYKQFTYAGKNFYKLSSQTTKLGATITYAYDERDVNHGGSGHAGLLTSTSRSYAYEGGTAVERTVLYYDSLDRLTKTVDPRQIAESFAYNSRHQLTQIKHSDSSVVVYKYDDSGNQISIQDENNHTTTFAYDEYRRIIKVTVPVNAPSKNNTQILSRSQTFDYGRYDTYHNRCCDSFCHTSSAYGVTYAPSGNGLQRVFSPANWVIKQFTGISVINGVNSLILSEGNGSVQSSATYYCNGQVQTVTDPQSFVTTYTYDNCNRIKTVSNPMGAAGHMMSYIYNPVGNIYAGLLSSISAPGTDVNSQNTVQTQFTSYDQMSHLKSTLDAAGYAFNSSYDAAGNLKSQDDGGEIPNANHQTVYNYDQLGRKKKILYADGTSEKWTYDSSGNVSTHTNRAGAICNFQYTDKRNRCNSYFWSSSGIGTNQTALSATYIYDSANQLKEVKNNAADIRFTYDDSGLVRSETETPNGVSNGLTTTYTYDKDGNIDSIKYPGDVKTKMFAYDIQERCTGVSEVDKVLSTYIYNRNRLRQRQLGNGLDTKFDYQSNGRVSYVWHTNSTTHTNVSERTYGYAPNGKVTWCERVSDSGGIGGMQSSGSSLENGKGDAYYYNANGSLSKAYQNYGINSSWPQEFSQDADSAVNTDNFVEVSGNTVSAYENIYLYDGSGNRTQVSQMNQGTVVYSDSITHPGENQYEGSTYDSDGNMIHSALNWSYVYDAENHLTSATGPGGQNVSFSYDPLGRVISQVANGVGTLFYYAGRQRIEEHDLSTNRVRYLYVYDCPGSDKLLCRRDPNTGSELWYLYDALGNTTHVANAVGQIVEQYLYDAYGKPSVYDGGGNLRIDGSNCDNRYLFKGAGAYEWLAQAGLYYCRARFYLPHQGRWLQPDPIGQAGGLNIYSYCGNDPVNGLDSSGLAVQDDSVKLSTGSHIPGTNTGAVTATPGMIGGNAFSDFNLSGGNFVNVGSGNYRYAPPANGLDGFSTDGTTYWPPSTGGDFGGHVYVTASAPVWLGGNFSLMSTVPSLIPSFSSTPYIDSLSFSSTTEYVMRKGKQVLVTHNQLGLDDDGHPTRYWNDRKWQPKTTGTKPNGSTFDGVKDRFGVAPISLSIHKDGVLDNGMTETIVNQLNGFRDNIPIEDFGHEPGEVSVAEGPYLGATPARTSYGPVPSGADIPTIVIYWYGTH